MAKTKETNKNQKLGEPQTIDFVLGRIIEQTNYRTKESLDTWRAAITMAESNEMPSYIPFYNLCREIELDAHVHGLVQQRVNRLLGLKFSIVDADGKEDPESMKIFERAWFYKFLRYYMDSKWWHHSLIQLWDKQPNGYGSVTLVPRNHVYPKKGWVVLQQGDTATTVNYRDPEYADWLIECGDPYDLGLFNKAAPNYLIKKNALLEWSKYAQIFGMPIRVGKTSSKLQADMQRMADNLKKMESAAYGVFQDGESIEFIESTKGDAFQVYKQLVETPNSEMSKLFVGQTMTTDNGSSKSQGEVHERVADSIAEGDKRDAEFLVNDQLIPKMIAHGFKLEGKRFQWSVSKDLTALMNMATQLLQYKNIPNDYLTETFGIPVEDKTEVIPPVPPAPPAPEPKPVKKKVQLSLLSKLTLLYANTCNHIHLADGNKPPESIDVDALAQFIFDNQDNPNVLHTDTYLKTAKQLYSAFRGGYKGAFEEAGAGGVKAKIEQNLYPFSAAKTFTQMNAMRDMLKDGEGKLRSFNEFKREIAATGTEFNVTYLNAEYNYAIASGQMADRWDEYERAAEQYPNLRYETAGDDRVREEHQKLDGVIRPVNDGFWDKYYPPNGWNCRCDVIQEDAPATPAPKRELLKKAVPPMFQNNVGKSKIVFTEGHPYFQNAKGQIKNLTSTSYGLPPVAELKRGELPQQVEEFADKKEFNTWAKDNLNGKKSFDLKTFDGTPVTIDKKVLQHVSGNEDGGHWQVSTNLETILNKPSEVFQYDEDGTLKKSFLKHFNEDTMVCVAALDDKKGWLVKTWYRWDGKSDIDNVRIGTLLQKDAKK